MYRCLKMLLATFFALVILLPLSGCGSSNAPTVSAASTGSAASTVSAASTGSIAPTGSTASTASAASTASNASAEEIIVLYTNDVHCGIDDYIGYSGLSAYKKELEAEGKNVLLVDCGDHIQGAPAGTLTKGDAIIKMMNEVGYDAATFGNHEFDFSLEQLLSLKEQANYPYVCCNFTDENGNCVTDPYTIIEAGGRKIAFIGAVTPVTIVSSTPAYFQNESGEFIYSFCGDESGTLLYDTIQKSVDSARAEGADICILLAHLGVNSEDGPYTSMNVIANTTGIDAVLDGHSHSVIESESVKNKDGKRVAYSQTGTKLEHIGCLTIAADGGMTTKLISDYEKKDADFDTFVEDVTGELNERLSEKIAETEFDLVISDENGNWIIRNGETNLGNLVVDSYRYAMGTEAAFVNSGNIRTEIFAGDITWRDIYSVLPYFNELTVVEVTGQQIADLLEFGAHAEPEQFGGFMQVSGISYTIDMSIPSGVKTDEKGMMTGIEGERRVKDIRVNGEPLDPERLYTVSGNRYALLGHGDGHTAFDGANELPHDYVEDSTALRNFLVEELGGVVPDEYSERYGTDRITLLP